MGQVIRDNFYLQKPNLRQYKILVHLWKTSYFQPTTMINKLLCNVRAKGYSECFDGKVVFKRENKFMAKKNKLKYPKANLICTQIQTNKQTNKNIEVLMHVVSSACWTTQKFQPPCQKHHFLACVNPSFFTQMTCQDIL